MEHRTKIRFQSLPLLTGSDLSRRKLPMIWAQSIQPHPVVWITACGHGDEVTGIVIVQELLSLVRKFGLQRGSLYAFPIMNPIGFENISRHIPFSDEDLNRSFPGNAEGSLAERIAHIIFTQIVERTPDLVIDLHNDWIRSIPYALVDPGKEHPTLEKARTYATLTGFASVLDTDLLRRSLSFNLLKKHIPAITLELGESYVVNEKNVAYGLRAILNILEYMGMVEPSARGKSYTLDQEAAGRWLFYCGQPRCSSTGILRFMVKPGQIVSKGKALAKIYNAYGRLQETLHAPARGLLLGHAESSLAYPGASVLSFGLLED